MVEVEEVILGEDGEKLSAADLLELELRDVIEEAEASGLKGTWPSCLALSSSG